MALKRFAISAPEESFILFQEKSNQAQVSLSKFLVRAGEVATTEQVVMFPLIRDINLAIKKALGEQGILRWDSNYGEFIIENKDENGQDCPHDKNPIFLILKESLK